MLSLRALIPLMLLACLASASARAEESFPDTLPDEIEIKTPQQTFNTFFSFALDDQGRIWAKPKDPGSKETKDFKPDWQLFGTGLPENKDIKDFAKPHKIVRIQGDADEIVAIDDGNPARMYSMRWLPNPKFAGSPRHWLDKISWPIEEPYFLAPVSPIRGASPLAGATRS